ncbi:DNA-processing protein DprA [Corynebacterium epidermidicanis]|uniref:DNA protecting protein DprA n=1 Tax=Corynebacterium epidermidicanis TaxID=1050174 RepID=A0A0G3GQK3_9CORY|nr:DNA-processing protein DprA [Corynebacterium epidermidicanis]AKK03419.1 DNA protecting protein DprA [Corynebacterium epidermidicanis]
MSDSRQLAWAYLSRCIEGPDRELQRLLSAGEDVEKIVHGIKNRESWLGPLLKTTQTRASVDYAREDLEAIKAIGGRLLTPDSPEWPTEQFDAAFGFAASGQSDCIRSMQDDAVAPHALWVKGIPLSELLAQAVAIVGTRAVSNYGREATRQLVQELVAHQWTIVSGGALGVDAVAHSVALETGGRSIAVAACGLDKTYPAAHRGLFRQISQHGALVSEYPPGISPARHRFLTRNRLVAALTSGTVVVEAAWRSGALNTLTWAEGLGRVAMAVPGPITGVGSLGCHERIRTGRAQLVVSADEIRELLSAIGELDVAGQYEFDFAPSPVQSLSRNEMRVYDATSAQARLTADIAADAGLSVALTVHLLVELQKRQLICREGDGWKRIESEAED